MSLDILIIFSNVSSWKGGTFIFDKYFSQDKKLNFTVRQLPDEATEHLHGERGGGGKAGL